MIDELLTPVADAASAAARTPEFADVTTRAAARSRRTAYRVTLSAGLATAAVVAVVGLALNDGSNEVPEPAPQPTPTNNATTPSPTPGHEIVDHPDARIYQIVVSATDPDVRAVMWGMPDGPPGALALTDDGFVTRGIVTPDGEMLSHLGEDWFVFGNAGEPNASLTTLDLTLVRTDGTMKQVRGTKDPGPIRPGEFFYTYTFGDGPITALAIDPDSGVAREAEVPELYSGITTGAEGRAWGTAANWYVHEPAFYYRSEDGGATWSSTQLANQGLWVYDAPRALGDPSLPVAVLEYARNDGQDNLAAVHRSTDDGRTFERIPLFVDNEGKSFGASGAVLPDGRLVVHVPQWIGGSEPTGLFVSDGDDWSKLSHLPGSTTGEVSFVASTDSVLVLARTDVEARASSDGGLTWQPFALR